MYDKFIRLSMDEYVAACFLTGLQMTSVGSYDRATIDEEASMKTDVPTAQVPLPLTDKRRRLTLEALADVDEGNAVDHRSVQAWADGLDGDKPVSLPR
ncbi:hypothetical protein HFO98_03825 [Rhizobium leguminosarum]|uniref:hypothetical protein n=1 Tax=Rhizobium leguminosarum TaxID=384 RepID=UPI001C950F22|nr:hypothetical protein [Rhizobium leguminosarum]MBY5407610.1 hypothetical protein [Rhizobium leguminosarum]